MERAGKIVRRLKLPGDTLSLQEIARAAWPRAVGKRIALRTRVINLRDGFLVVEVADEVWQNQLAVMDRFILANLQRLCGEGITGLEFRLGVARRPVQSALSNRSADEADGIQDPVLRRVYKISRQRSLLA